MLVIAARGPPARKTVRRRAGGSPALAQRVRKRLPAAPAVAPGMALEAGADGTQGFAGPMPPNRGFPRDIMKKCSDVNGFHG
jgi:hypothetical protein